jgi:hypothetical protein
MKSLKLEGHTVEEIKEFIINAGYKAVAELIKIAEEAVIGDSEEDSHTDISADRLKNAAATKKLAIFDAFEILSKIEEEKSNIDAMKGIGGKSKEVQFAEGRIRK